MDFNAQFEYVIEDLFDYDELSVFLAKCVDERPGRPAKLRNIVSSQKHMPVVAFNLREWLRVRTKLPKFVECLKLEFPDNPNVQSL